MKFSSSQLHSLTLLSPGRGEGGGRFLPTANLNLNYFWTAWYEPETSWLFITFTGDYFAGEKNSKNIKLSGAIFLHISLPGVLSKNKSSNI